MIEKYKKGLEYLTTANELLTSTLRLLPDIDKKLLGFSADVSYIQDTLAELQYELSEEIQILLVEIEENLNETQLMLPGTEFLSETRSA